MKIELKNVCKKFKKNLALNNINYVFSSGNIYGITGRNGSGKTVLLKIISGMYKKSSGEMLIDGALFDPYISFINTIGILIDGPAFIDDLTGFQNLQLLASINCVTSDKEIDELINLFNLFDYRDIKYKEYSIGSKQKLGIIQAIMERQKIILLDEPFNGVERETVIKIKKYLKSICDKNTIIIITSHVSDDLNDFANVMLKMDNGELLKN